MEMWDWLQDCYDTECLTVDEMEHVLFDDVAAKQLWDDWAEDSYDFVDFVREEVSVFLSHIRRVNDE